MNDNRTYPDRPFLAVSAGIIREGRILIVRRARKPANGVYTFPGGVVEAGETLTDAVMREVREETGLIIEPVVLAGYREAIFRDGQNKVARHFVVMSFAARWVSGEIALNEELDDAQWMQPSDIAGMKTTEGLGEIVASVYERMGLSL